MAGNDNCFWLLCYAEKGVHKVVVTEAPRVIQESYIDEDKPEDLLVVFTSTEAATLFIAALGRTIGAEHNDNFRIVSTNMSELLAYIGGLDKIYQSKPNSFLRVEICELNNNELRREILFSRQIVKH